MKYYAFCLPQEGNWIISRSNNIQYSKYRLTYYLECEIIDELEGEMVPIVNKFPKRNPEIGDTCYTLDDKLVKIKSIY